MNTSLRSYIRSSTWSIWLFGLVLLSQACLASASEDAVRFNLRTRIGGAAPVELSVTVPFGASRVVPAAGSLSYHIEVGQPREGRAFARLSLQDANGRAYPRTTNGLPLAAGEIRSVSYTVCDDRVIQEEAVPARAARCTDLPFMAKADPRPDGCLECLGAYEGMPKSMSSRAAMVAPREPGQPLLLTGRVTGPDGAPRGGVVVYAFQTNSMGLYPMAHPARSTFSQSHGTLRAWVRSDNDGRYTFDTIRPGAYPDRREPEHIHMVVIEPGCASYFLEDIHFSDDPLMQSIPKERLKDLLTGIGGSGVVAPQRDARSGNLVITRDIELGKNFANYPACLPD